VLLALFAQMERTYTMERAAHARALAAAKGRRVGRPVLVDAAKLEWRRTCAARGKRSRRSSRRPGSRAPAFIATSRRDRRRP
jgi:hypothetical protein